MKSKAKNPPKEKTSKRKISKKKKTVESPFPDDYKFLFKKRRRKKEKIENEIKKILENPPYEKIRLAQKVMINTVLSYLRIYQRNKAFFDRVQRAAEKAEEAAKLEEKRVFERELYPPKKGRPGLLPSEKSNLKRIFEEIEADLEIKLKEIKGKVRNPNLFNIISEELLSLAKRKFDPLWDFDDSQKKLLSKYIKGRRRSAKQLFVYLFAVILSKEPSTIRKALK